MFAILFKNRDLALLSDEKFGPFGTVYLLLLSSAVLASSFKVLYKSLVFTAETGLEAVESAMQGPLYLECNCTDDRTLLLDAAVEGLKVLVL